MAKKVVAIEHYRPSENTDSFVASLRRICVESVADLEERYRRILDEARKINPFA